MKKLSAYFAFGIVLLTLSARADLLDRMNLEDGFRLRIREVVKVFDPQAQIMTQFSYRTYQGTLPGTTLTYDSKTIPTNIEDQDLARVDISVYSSKNEFPKEMENLIRSSLPVDSRKVQIKFLEMKVIPETNEALTNQLIERTVSKVVNDLAQTISWAVGVAVAVLLLCFGFVGWRRQKQFSQAINRVVTSLSDLQSPQNAAVMNSSLRQAEKAPPKALTSPTGSIFGGYELESIQAMLADCYWTEKDGYAVWIWKNLDFTQRNTLLETLPYMKNYSISLTDVPEKQFPFFDHAYYLRPQKLHLTSQEDLLQVVEAYPSTWHKLSPLRQAEITLPLEEKIKCMNVSVKDADQAHTFPQSKLRMLTIKGSWGELKEEDEKQIHINPDLVPRDMRGQIKSLVWLNLLPDERIKEKLERLDAQSLASAWVGPEEMLARLENLLPEKKKALLQGYRSRVTAQRESPAFVWLWEESLKDESA